MNFNANQLKQVLSYINKYRLILAWLIILGLFGFTLLRAQAISDPEANAEYMREQKEVIEGTVLNIDEDLRTQIEGLLETPVDTTPDNLGTGDPFNP